MTLAEITAQLRSAGIEGAASEARALICRFESISSAVLLADPGRDFCSRQLSDAVARRVSREPLQYILGTVGFYHEEYEVSPACLIPRADTELLVEEAIRRTPSGTRFADLCTGSGCIAISVLAARQDLTAVAVDISAEALAIAAKNAQKNGVADRLTLVQADLLSDIPDAVLAVDTVLSNPPYIRRAVIPTLDIEVQREPVIALDGGEDGLLFYRRMLKTLSPSLFLFEIGYDQKEDLLSLSAATDYKALCLRDLGDRDRVMILEK